MNVIWSGRYFKVHSNQLHTLMSKREREREIWLKCILAYHSRFFFFFSCMINMWGHLCFGNLLQFCRKCAVSQHICNYCVWKCEWKDFKKSGLWGFHCTCLTFATVSIAFSVLFLFGTCVVICKCNSCFLSPVLAYICVYNTLCI